jgi:hypothetical protein
MIKSGRTASEKLPRTVKKLQRLLAVGYGAYLRGMFTGGQYLAGKIGVSRVVID